MAAYFGVNAFTFRNAAGHALPVRYRFVPGAGENYLAQALKARSPDYLVKEIGPGPRPINFTGFAQIGERGDKVDNSSLAWPETRRLVNLGIITINKASENTPERDRACWSCRARFPQVSESPTPSSAYATRPIRCPLANASKRRTPDGPARRGTVQ
jgi:catalase